MSNGIETPESAAAKLGLDVVYPRPDQLFIDIDTEQAFTHFQWARNTLDGYGAIGIKSCEQRPSVSGLPFHFHITITLTEEVTPRERILLQLMLGSDAQRETLSFCALEADAPHPTVFFEKPAVHSCEFCAAPVPMVHHIPHSTPSIEWETT